MTPRPRTSSRRIAVVLAASGALFLSACTASSGGHFQAGGRDGGVPESGASAARSATLGTVAITPAPDAANVTPNTPIQVTASGTATVTSVTVTAGAKTIAGSLSADGKTWTSTGKLAFGTKYTVKANASNATNPTMSATFTTAKASTMVKGSLEANLLNALHDGGTYGVGQPLIVHFNKSLTKSQQATVVAALDVTTSPYVEGRWHWVNSQQVDYRAEKYWATGTTIEVTANLYGVPLGSGAFGATNTHATIHIGDSHIAIADNKTHRMKVYVNDALVRTVKVSMGMGGSTIASDGSVVNYWTRNGPHIVLEKSPSVTMSSASYGITDPKSRFFYAPETVKDDARISYSGEFVHLRTWTVGDIGVRNTSHGCINVGIADAMYMYNLLRPGDIVDVVNSPVPISFANTQADWIIPWSKW